MTSHSAPLREQDADPDPLRQFAAWYEQAAASGIRLPEAAAVASASADGAPSVRMVLVKSFGDSGFVFYTGYGSRKARELEANPRAALLFHWDELGRQVRIEGPVEPTSSEESAAYVRSRARGSQLSALASPQSEVVADRRALEQRYVEVEQRYGTNPPRPSNWGGYRVLPHAVEFWQGRPNRLHDRFRYTREGELWRIDRLSP